MTKVQLILLLSIIIVILLLIDAFRRSKRKKYQREIAKLQVLQEQERAAKKALSTPKHANKNTQPKIQTPLTPHKIELDEDIKVDPQADILISELETAETTYPQLEKGLVTYYISAPRGYIFNGEDLDTLFQHNGLSYNAEEQSFELLTQDKDALFSIKADAPIEGFDPENFNQTDYTRLVCICDIAELAQFYEPAVCFEHFSQSVDKINARLGGTLLNEHKRRFTSHDESAYKSQLKKFESHNN